MKRLTYKRNDGYAINLPNALSEKDETLEWTISERENGIRLEGDIPNRLAAIEDILGDGYDLDRLRELVEADKDGRCVVLPCRIGQNVYRLITKGIGKWFMEELTVKGIEYNGFDVDFSCCSKPDEKGCISWCDISQDSIGKTVFRTREDAKEHWEGLHGRPWSEKRK